MQHIDWVGHVAGNTVESVHFFSHNGLALLKTYRVGVHRIFENLLHGALFHHSACVHNHDVVHHFGNDAQIVSDEHDRSADFVFYVTQQVENLRLNGDVKRGCRLVGDDKFGIAAKCHCNHNSLPHTARQLVRIGLVHVLGHRYADKFEHLDALLFCHLLVRAVNVKKGDFVKLVAYRKNGVERGHRLLEDHRDFSAPDFRHFRDRRFGDVIDHFAFFKDFSVTRFAVSVKRWFHHRLAVFVKHLIAVFVKHGFGDLFRAHRLSLR